MDFFGSNWFFFAILGVAIGAVVHIIDVSLRENDVFLSPIEPTIVSGILQAMLWFAIPFVGFERPESWSVSALAVFAGMLHIGSLFFYFKAIFLFGDISLVSMLWNLLVAVVPLLAFFLLGETLTMTEYAGIFLLFAGALLLSSSRGVNASLIPKVSRYMLVAVFLMGLSMVCMKDVYEQTAYWGGYLLYNFGIVGGAVLGYIFFLPKRDGRRFQKTCWKFFGFFVGIEFLQLAGEFCSNVATDLGSVSLVSAVESLQPAFVVFFSVMAFVCARIFFQKKSSLFREMCLLQLQNFFVKGVAFVSMFFGTYLIR